MANNLKYNDPLFIIWRKGTVQDPYVSKTESRNVIDNRVVLSEIPDPFTHVTITGYTEVFTDTPLSNQFQVDYGTGIVSFNVTEEGKSVQATYKSRGLVQYPAERIFSHTDNPDVVQNLQEIIDNGQAAIKANTTLSETITRADAAITAANTAATNTNNAIADANTVAANTAYKGAWSSTVAYKKNNTVVSGNTIYVNIADAPAGTVVTDTTYWQVGPSTQAAVDSANSATTSANNAATAANTAKTNADTATTAANTAKANADAATTSANTAASNADAKATLANNAATAANTATTNADTATAQANTARDSANTAATAANTAKTNADTATTNANAARDAANTAKTNADTATANANTASTNANTAATSADNAATAANTAKTNADTATAAANTATTNANTAVTNLSHVGAYASATQYYTKNIVTYNGSSYMAVADSKDVVPTDTTKWKLVGSKGDTGAQGIQGIQGVKGDQGISFIWKGTWSNTTAYSANDAVSYLGASYLCTVATTAGNVPTDATHWNLMADGNSAATVKNVEFTATAGQTLFSVTTGQWETGKNLVQVFIDGVRQNPSSFTETSVTSITLSEGVPVGTTVSLQWFESLSMAAHAATHAVGGTDDLSAYYVAIRAGNVGIGTTSPSAKLHVAGDTRIEGQLNIFSAVATTNSGIEIGSLTAATTPFIDFHSSGNSVDFDSRIIASGGTTTNGQGNLELVANTIFSMANIGLGTASPGARFAVMQSTPTASSYLRAGSGAYGFVEIGIPNTVDGKAFLSFHRGGAVAKQIGISGMDLVFASAGGASKDTLDNEQLRITNSGNVGIGTTAPLDKLHVAGNISVDGQIRSNTTTGVTSIYTNTMSTNGPFIEMYGSAHTSSPGNVNVGANENGKIIFRHYKAAASNWPVMMTIDGATEFVGIGTEAPSEKLHVHEGSVKVTRTTNQPSLILEGASAGFGSGMVINNTTATTGRKHGIYSGSEGNLWITDETAGAGRIVISPTGNVGMGTTSPISKLHVSGGDVTIDRFLKVGATDSRAIDFGPAGQMFLNGDAGGWAFGYYAKGSAGTNRGGFGFTGSADTVTYYYIGAAYQTPTAAFTPSGSVGIGTTTPLDMLQVSGNASAQMFKVYGNADRIVAFHDATSPNARKGYIGYINSTTPAGIWILNATSGSALKIQDDGVMSYPGAVGIATAAPDASVKLHVNGKVRTDDSIGINSPASTPGLQFLNGGVMNSQIWATSTGDAVTIQVKGVDGLRVMTNGVAIGTSVPSEKLHVVGNALIDGAIRGASTTGQLKMNYMSVAAGATAQLGKDASFHGFVFIIEGMGAQPGIFYGRGVNATVEISDVLGKYSVTAGTATSTNVYYSTANARIEIQNNTGAATNYTVLIWQQ